MMPPNYFNNSVDNDNNTMTDLLDIPSDIINLVLPICKLDKEMLRCSCKTILKLIPHQKINYEDPTEAAFSESQLKILLNYNMYKLCENVIVRGRLDLIDILKNLSECNNKDILSKYAAKLGSLSTYLYVTPTKQMTTSHARYALENGNLGVLKDLQQRGCGLKRNSYSTDISISAIESGNLEMVKYIHEQRHYFSPNCIQHTSNLEIIKFLRSKGFLSQEMMLNILSKIMIYKVLNGCIYSIRKRFYLICVAISNL